MKKPLVRLFLMLACLSALSSCSSGGSGKKNCDSDGVCRIGYKINVDKNASPSSK